MRFSGSHLHHVDLPIYATGAGGLPRLALGFRGSKAADKVWEQSDPLGILKALNDRHPEADGQQVRPGNRHLKRWKALWFPHTGQAARPLGVEFPLG